MFGFFKNKKIKEHKNINKLKEPIVNKYFNSKEAIEHEEMIKKGEETSFEWMKIHVPHYIGVNCVGHYRCLKNGREVKERLETAINLYKIDKKSGMSMLSLTKDIYEMERSVKHGAVLQDCKSAALLYRFRNSLRILGQDTVKGVKMTDEEINDFVVQLMTERDSSSSDGMSIIDAVAQDCNERKEEENSDTSPYTVQEVREYIGFIFKLETAAKIYARNTNADIEEGDIEDLLLSEDFQNLLIDENYLYRGATIDLDEKYRTDENGNVDPPVNKLHILMGKDRDGNSYEKKTIKEWRKVTLPKDENIYSGYEESGFWKFAKEHNL